MKIRARLVLTHLALVIAVVAGLEIVLFAGVRSRVRALFVEEMHGSAALIDQALAGAQGEPLDETVDRFAHAIGSRVTIIAADGNVLADSDVPAERLASLESHADRPEVVEALRSGRGSSLRWSSTVKQDMLYAARRAPDGRVIRIARPAERVVGATRGAQRALLLLGALAVGAAVVLALAVSSRLARPLVSLTDAARVMAAGDLARRIESAGNDELAHLGAALNDLARSFGTTIDQVTAERNRLAGVLAGMVEGVLVVDAAGRVVMLNPSLRETFGIVQEDVAGRRVLEIARFAELHEWISSVLAGGEPLPKLLAIHAPHERTMEVRFSILGNQDSRVAGLVAVFHDVTDLRRLEIVRRDFVANASHELKTPVAAILGASETLAGGALADKEAATRFLGVIERNATRLAALVEDLLDLSRLETRGGAELREVRPAEALAKSAAHFRDQAAEKSITLTIVDANGVDAVRGDPALIERALTNLVQNAVRYTPKNGRVALRAVQTGDSVRFEVEDNGIGIPPQALPRIFERFYRVDPARSRELGGTGLGLAIVKHAVESMGGTVDVTSEPGRGSTFSFTLPVWDG